MPSNCTSIICVYPRLHIALCSADEARILHRSRLRNMDFFTLEDQPMSDKDGLFSPFSLVEIHRFASKLLLTLRSHQEHVVICASRNNQRLLTNTGLMIGGFMILGKSVDLEDVNTSFSPIMPHFLPYHDPTSREGTSDITISDCWKALSLAKIQGWIVLNNSSHLLRIAEEDSQVAAADSFDPEECVHYADPLNADLHILIPGKLLVIANPVDLPAGRQWMDAGTTRKFSPEFFADLLCDFNVVLVICLDECQYDRSAFTERGIGVEELRVRRESPNMLRAADRFLSLLAAAPGAVALHGGEACLHYTGPLVSAHMMLRLRFDAAAAASWLRIVCPRLVVPAGFLAELRSGAADVLHVADPCAHILRCLSVPHLFPDPAQAAADTAAADAADAAAANPAPASQAKAFSAPPLNKALSLPNVIL